MDLTENILCWLGRIEDIERGYWLFLRSTDGDEYYLSSCGNHYFIVYDYRNDEKVEEWGYCESEEFIKHLRRFIEQNKIIEAELM